MAAGLLVSCARVGAFGAGGEGETKSERSVKHWCLDPKCYAVIGKSLTRIFFKVYLNVSPGASVRKFSTVFFLDNILIYEQLTQMTTIHSSASRRSLAIKTDTIIKSI